MRFEVFPEMFLCVYLLCQVTFIRLEITCRGIGLVCVCVGVSIYCLRYLDQFKPVAILFCLEFSCLNHGVGKEIIF